MMEMLQSKLLEVRRNLKQAEANLHALQGAEQVLEQLINEVNKDEDSDS